MQMNFFDKCWQEGEGEELVSRNPATGNMMWSGNVASVKQVNQAVTSADNAVQDWLKLGLENRLEMLRRYVELVDSKRTEIAWLIADETGKTYWGARIEIDESIRKLKASEKAFKKRCSNNTCELSNGDRVLTRYRPLGVMAIIEGFSLAVYKLFGHLMPALIAGNTVVIKPSEQAPGVTQKLVELWVESGGCPSVVSLLHGGPQVGEWLAEDKKVAGILFTGRRVNGESIEKKAYETKGKLTVLEMGANNALVVWDVEEIKSVAYNILLSAFIYSGQCCTCVHRLILPSDAIGDLILRKLIELVERLVVGLPRDEEQPFIGPLISNDAADMAMQRQDELEKLGGVSMLKMYRSDHCAALIHPGVIDVTALEEPCDVEVLAPLLQVIRAESFEHAIELSEQSKYGLGSCLISDREGLYKQFRECSSAGIVYWNRPLTALIDVLPRVARGCSGNSRTGAYFSADFCSYPVVSIEGEHASIPEYLMPGIRLEDGEDEGLHGATRLVSERLNQQAMKLKPLE